jgi:hypothetical protein
VTVQVCSSVKTVQRSKPVIKRVACCPWPEI